MKVHVLSESHAEAFSRLRLEALESEPAAFGSSAGEHLALTPEEIAKRIRAEEPEKFVVGAFDGDALVGMAGFRRGDSVKARHRGILWGVYVTPAHRGKGVAKNVVKAVIERVAAYPEIEQLHLTVSAPQDGARALYQSLGFESWGLEPRALKIGAGQYVDEHHMVLRLRNS